MYLIFLVGLGDYTTRKKLGLILAGFVSSNIVQHACDLSIPFAAEEMRHLTNFWLPLSK